VTDYGRLKGSEDKAGLHRRNPNSAGPSTAQRQVAPSHPILRLQRQVGNNVVSRMLAQREIDTAVQREEEETEDEAVQAKFDSTVQREESAESEDEQVQAKFDGTVQREESAESEDEQMQAKFDTTVQREEEESEDESVQAKFDSTVQREESGEAEDEEVQAKFDGAIQREGDEDEMQAKFDSTVQREGDEDEMQAKFDTAVQREGDDALQLKPEVGLEGGAVSDGVASQIQTMRGGGNALDSDTQSEMEGHFGTGLGDVRVHTGSESSALNHRLGALAFTTGSDIFMRDDAFQAGSDSGKQLLSHELTHVVQQRSMPSSGGGMHVGPAGDQYEQAADAKASEIMSAAPAGAGAGAGAGGSAQRHIDE
jgi:hypothetical protein